MGEKEGEKLVVMGMELNLVLLGKETVVVMFLMREAEMGWEQLVMFLGAVMG